MTRNPAQLTQDKGQRAAIYARVSDKSQDTEEKTSISEQISDMEAYCERKGLTIVARYQEVGRGWVKSRPEFQRMLAHATEGRFDTIVCWKSDRLSRGMYPAAALMEVVDAHRIGLEAVMDAIDVKTFGLLAAVGKIELDNFRERSSMGKRGKAKQGRIPIGGIPYGYRIGDGGRPIIDESQGDVVRRIFREYVHEGLGSHIITRQLNDEEIPTSKPTARQWHGSHVLRMLSQEAYKGTWWYGKARNVTTENGRKAYQQPKDSWIGIPFPPLVDDETWEKAQRLKEQRKMLSKRNTRQFHLLQHLVRCAECGRLFGVRVAYYSMVKQNGKVYHYDFNPPRRHYQCYGMIHRQFRCREHPFIKAERLEELIWSEVKKAIENPSLIAAGIESLDADEAHELSGALADAERELRNVQQEEDRAIRLYVSGKITEGQLDHERKFITGRQENLRAKINEYRARKTAAVEGQQLMEKVVQWAGTVGQGLDELPPQERREVLKLVLDRVTIDRDNNVSITLAVPTGDLVAIEQQACSCWWRP